MPNLASSLQNQLAARSRRLARRLWIVTALTAVCVSNGLAANLPASTTLTWVPAEAIAIISIRPNDLATQKSVGGLASVPMADILEKFGLTAEMLDQICLLIFPPEEKGAPPREPSIIFRLKTPENITLKFPGSGIVEAKEHMGTKYESSGPNALAQVDPQTLIHGPEEDLKRLIEGGPDSKSPLVKSTHWQSIAAQPVAAAIDMQTVSKIVPLEEGPPPFQAMLAPLWSDVSQVYLAGRSDEALKLLVVIQGREGATLQKTKDTLTAAQTMAKNMLDGMRGQVPPNAEGPAALMGTFIDIGDNLLKSVKVYDLPDNSIKILASLQFDAKQSAALAQSVIEAREAAKRAASLNNLKQLSLALLQYETQYRHFPPAVFMGKDNKGGVPHSWRVAMLPYLDAQDLYDAYHFDEPWDSENNQKILAKMPAVFRHPDDQPDSVNTSYFAVVGSDTLFSKPEGVAIAGIRDGTSNTVMLLEAKLDIPWTKPADIEISPDKPLPKLGGWRGAGYAAAFGDGHVLVFEKGIEEKLLRALLSINGGEVINPNEFNQ